MALENPSLASSMRILLNSSLASKKAWRASSELVLMAISFDVVDFCEQPFAAFKKI